MIRFKRDGTGVNIEIDATVPNWDARVFTMRFEAGVEWAAGLLAQLFKDTLWNRLKSIREKAYARGWADAKAKRARDPYFTGTINDV